MSLTNAVRELVRQELRKHMQSVEVREMVRAVIRDVFAFPVEKSPARRVALTTEKPFSKPSCNVRYCRGEMRSRGYCGKHYTKARRNGWEMPAPKGYRPPESAKVGRPKVKASPSGEKVAVPPVRRQRTEEFSLN